jgi:predicted transcriptional regulator
MSKFEPQSSVLTIRVSRDLDRRLASEARRRRTTRSAVAREILESNYGGSAPQDPLAEARRQSLLARDRASERDALQFAIDTADLKGWE